MVQVKVGYQNIFDSTSKFMKSFLNPHLRYVLRYLSSIVFYLLFVFVFSCEDEIKPRDTDSDGVNDNVDLCLDTPIGEPVNSEGCSLSQIDTDGDGISDDKDICPDTNAEDPVNSAGCSLMQIDKDGDGVPQKFDLCPNTQQGETVNLDGCSLSQLDSDGDGVSDDQDLCPDTPENRTTDENGCPYYVLEIVTYGNGEVTPSQGTYLSGEVVELNANPLSGFVFSGWSGDIESMDNPIMVTMDSDKQINANFSLLYNSEVDNIIALINQDSLTQGLRFITGEDSVYFNTRAGIRDRKNYSESNKIDNYITSEYLNYRLGSYGLNPVDQQYSTYGRNIYAIQEGTVYPDEYYIICAHYDATAVYCADDNGSGVSTVLEAARILSPKKFKYSIIYAFWDEEELGKIGSKYFAGQAAANGDKIKGVFNMDMIAWDGDKDRVVEVHTSNLSASDELAKYIFEVDRVYNIDLEVNIMLPGTSASDHSSFWDRGYPSVLLIEEYYGGDFNPYYHTDEDRIDILDMSYFYEVSKLAIGSLASKALISK